VLCTGCIFLLSTTGIAKLNLRAGEKALESSAFSAAANYLASAIKFLPENPWGSVYELCLELVLLAAVAKYCIGTSKPMRKYCDQILAQADHPLLDKWHACSVVLDGTC
jgi:predicted ATPase